MNMPLPVGQLLVIDPCGETQSRIARYVQGRGFSVTSVPDPMAAMTTIVGATPDIVITDLFLPDGAGLALVKELKARHEPCPVIVMAHNAPEPLIVEALRGGAIDYLHKPVAEEELPVEAAHVVGAHRGDDVLHVHALLDHVEGRGSARGVDGARKGLLPGRHGCGEAHEEEGTADEGRVEGVLRAVAGLVEDQHRVHGRAAHQAGEQVMRGRAGKVVGVDVVVHRRAHARRPGADRRDPGQCA